MPTPVGAQNGAISLTVEFDQPISAYGLPVESGFTVTVDQQAWEILAGEIDGDRLILELQTIEAGADVQLQFSNDPPYLYDDTGQQLVADFALASTNDSTVRSQTVGGGFVYADSPQLVGGVVRAGVGLEGSRNLYRLVNQLGTPLVDTDVQVLVDDQPRVVGRGQRAAILGSIARITIEAEDTLQAVAAAQEWQRQVADRVVRAYAGMRDQLIESIDEYPFALALELSQAAGLLTAGPPGPQGPPGLPRLITSSDQSLLVSTIAGGYDIIINQITPLAISSFGPGVTAERGQQVGPIVFSWAYNEGDASPDVSQSIDQGVGVIDVDDRQITIPGPIDTPTTYTITGVDLLRGTATRSASVTFSWRVFWGVTTSALLQSAEIAAGSSALSNSRQRDITYDASGGRYFWYAYPDVLGALNTLTTRINGLTFSDWSDGAGGANTTGYQQLVDTVYLAGVLYRVYRSFNLQNSSTVNLEYR